MISLRARVHDLKELSHVGEGFTKDECEKIRKPSDHILMWLRLLLSDVVHKGE